MSTKPRPQFRVDLTLEEALDVVFALGYAKRAFQRDYEKVTRGPEVPSEQMQHIADGCKARLARFGELEQKYSGIMSRPPINKA